ncbi:MAG: nucleotidyltransferase family protein [Bacteroidales bacterium]|nr:nucleotidyltransferase family protein [Bacteroidales bacterium]
MKSKQDKINSILITTSDSILSALKKMDETFKRLLLVFDGDKFINILSIGDLQRAIIHNKSLETPVKLILRKDTKIAQSHDSFLEIKQQMMEYRTECMPVLDEQKKLVDVYFWEDFFPPEIKRIKRELGLPVVIMAGGKGSRLKPITNVLPKPLIPIGEKTILEHIMSRFSNVGCNDFHLSVNYKANMIRYYFDTLNHPDYNISYFEEKKPLGTAGSLYMLKDRINQTFFISNCDIIIEEDYGEIYNYHKENQNELTIIAALKHYPIPYGTIETGENGILKKLSEKPELTIKINSGMYILEPHLIEEIPKNKFFHITDLIDQILKRKGQIGVFPVSEGSWKDIGTWTDYLFEINKK